MSVTHGTPARAAMAQAILDLIDAGAAGHVKIYNSSNTVLADVTLADPGFTRSGAVLTMAGAPKTDSSADASGTADHFEVQDDASAKVWGGSVTATGGGGDMTVDNILFAATQQFSITSLTYTAPV